MLRSANMSLGVNTLLKLLKEAAPVLYPAGFDVEIVEKLTIKRSTLPAVQPWLWQTRSTSLWTIPVIINMTGSVRESPEIRKKSEFSLSAAAQS